MKRNRKGRTRTGAIPTCMAEVSPRDGWWAMINALPPPTETFFGFAPGQIALIREPKSTKQEERAIRAAWRALLREEA